MWWLYDQEKNDVSVNSSKQIFIRLVFLTIWYKHYKNNTSIPLAFKICVHVCVTNYLKSSQDWYEIDICSSPPKSYDDNVRNIWLRK